MMLARPKPSQKTFPAKNDQTSHGKIRASAKHCLSPSYFVPRSSHTDLYELPNNALFSGNWRAYV
jgi:hypothetical protein